MLQRLGFNATVQNPYGSIVNYLQVLDLTGNPDVPQRAWSFANDACVPSLGVRELGADRSVRLLTPLLVLHPPHYIAVSAIYLACLTAVPQVALPMEPAPWWELFDVPSEEAIHEILQPLLELYSRWTGGTQWLAQGSEMSMAGKSTVWRKAAELELPLAKEDVRRLLAKSA